jgi:hypothetical protein
MHETLEEVGRNDVGRQIEYFSGYRLGCRFLPLTCIPKPFYYRYIGTSNLQPVTWELSETEKLSYTETAWVDLVHLPVLPQISRAIARGSFSSRGVELDNLS